MSLTATVACAVAVSNTCITSWGQPSAGSRIVPRAISVPGSGRDLRAHGVAQAPGQDAHDFECELRLADQDVAKVGAGQVEADCSLGGHDGGGTRPGVQEADPPKKTPGLKPADDLAVLQPLRAPLQDDEEQRAARPLLHDDRVR